MDFMPQFSSIPVLVFDVTDLKPLEGNKVWHYDIGLHDSILLLSNWSKWSNW